MEPGRAQKIEQVARDCHEANRFYCESIGDTSQPKWEDAPDWQRSSCINGVEGALAGNTPRQSHESWLRGKTETGWSWGPVKDPETKTHPCFVPYDELPESQQVKDLIFVITAKVAAGRLGV
jgi:hypothetical protein